MKIIRTSYQPLLFLTLISTYKPSVDVSVFNKVEDMSSLILKIIPLPFMFLSRLYLVKPSISNCAVGNEESILVSDINRMSTLSFTIFLENQVYFLKN